MFNGIIIAGASSGSGKTTLSIGLMKALKNRGFSVKPFKTGPDYIDPMFHRKVLGTSSYNLPLWMVEDDTIEYLYHKHIEAGDFAVVEGVMGFFDGHSTIGLEGSTAYLADLLKLPVMLIFDAGSMSLSAAAIVKGFKEFHEPTAIKGVLLNNVNSKEHFEMLKEAIERHTQIKCYGYFPCQSEIAFESRHLGLLQAEEITDLKEKVDIIANVLEKTVDISAIINDFTYVSEAVVVNNFETYTRREDELKSIVTNFKGKYGPFKLGVARDEAFAFYYDENLELLEKLGLELVYFSPMRDEHFREDLDALYIGGGYPEVFGNSLEKNQPFRMALQQALKKGLPCYAECGGLMYLTQSIENLDGSLYEMIGFFDATSKMTKSLQHFGHVHVKVKHPMAMCGISSQPIQYRAHEFHKSIIVENKMIEQILSVSKKEKNWNCGYFDQKVLATYAHNHFYSNLEFLKLILELWFSNKREIN